MTELAIVRDTEPDTMPKVEEKPISAYILGVMEEEGWSQKDVLDNAKALKIKLRQSTLSEIITGETSNPQIFTLIDISRALHRPFEEMAVAIQANEEQSLQYTNSDFSLMANVYGRLTGTNQDRANDLIDMVKRKMIEMLKQQGSRTFQKPRQ